MEYSNPTGVQLSGLLGYQLRRASSAVMSELAQELAPFGLRPTLYAILSIIESVPGANQTELGRRLAIQRANMVPMLSELERAGWIERSPSPNDRRSRVLSIAPSRQKDLANIHTAVQASDDAIVARTGGEAEHLRSVLSRIWQDQA